MADGLDLSEIVRRTVQANAKFYKGWMDLSFEYFRGISEILGGATESAAPVKETDSGAGALVLEGEVGSVVRGAFLVTNDLGRALSCEFAGSDFKDPGGASVLAKPTFEPASLELGPGEQRVIQVAIAVDDRLSPGVGYAGEFFVKGMDGFSVPVVLRRRHRIEESPIGGNEPAVAQRASAPNDALTSRGKAAVKKGSGKKRATR